MRTLQAATCTLEPHLEAHAAEMFDVLCDPAIYEFENAPPASARWLAERFRRGGSRESSEHYGVQTFVAVLMARNFRSQALLRRLGFEPADPQQQDQYRDEPDEMVMVWRPAGAGGVN